MKKVILSLATAAMVFAYCGCSGSEKEKEPTAKESKDDKSSNPDYQKGLELVAKSDCLTCHKIEDKLIGPSYVDVANKYANTPENITKLANTIINGVTPDKAVWGTLPMTAHAQLSQADAEQMVKYVLLLKK